MINDPEIDLTEYRDFRGNNVPRGFITNNTNIYNYIQSITRKQIYGDSFPWNVVPIFSEMHSFDGLVALGNKEQRKQAIVTKYWGCVNNVCCDCCGKKYTKILWKKDWGLCKKCSENQHSFIERVPWDTTRIGVQRFLGEFWTRERR